MIGAASILGRISEGFLLDRFPGNLIGGASLLLPVLACASIYWSEGSVFSAFVIAFLLGLALGSETNVVAYLSTRYFGMRSYGVLFGVIVSLISLGAGVGPFFSSAVYDITGNYNIVMGVVAIICFIFSFLIMKLGRYPNFRA